MKMSVERHRITIAPDNDTDIAYLEDTLGLRKEGDFVLLKRTNAMSLGCIAYVETAKVKEELLVKKYMESTSKQE